VNVGNRSVIKEAQLKKSGAIYDMCLMGDSNTIACGCYRKGLFIVDKHSLTTIHQSLDRWILAVGWVKDTTLILSNGSNVFMYDYSNQQTLSSISCRGVWQIIRVNTYSFICKVICKGTHELWLLTVNDDNKLQ
jgi:hypothetical protein